MKKIRKTKIEKFAEASVERLHDLRFRWQDECQYEDLQDYLRPFRKIAKACGVQLIAMKQRPFGILVSESKVPSSGCCKLPALHEVAVYSNGQSVIREARW